MLKKAEMKLAEGLMRDFPGNVNAIILMGNVCERHGEAVRAIEFFKKALALDPNRPTIYQSMGWFHMHKGEYEEAIMHWQKALQINPACPGVHNDIARALMGLGKHEEAIAEFEKDIQISPRAATSHFLLGQLYLRQGRFEKARTSYEEAIAIQPTHTNAYYGLFTLCAKLKQSAKAREYMAIFKKLKAEDMKTLKDRNNARDDLIKMQKGAAETFRRAGQMYGTGGNVQKAEALLKRAARLDPTQPASLYSLAYFYHTSNRTAEALQMYTRAAEIDRENPLCYLNIGILSSRLKHIDEADEAFRKVIKLTPKSSTGYRELAQLYLRTGRGLPEARTLAEKAVALEPIAVNYFVLSWAWDMTGDSTKALMAIERAMQLEPGNPKYKKVYEHIKSKN